MGPRNVSDQIIYLWRADRLRMTFLSDSEIEKRRIDRSREDVVALWEAGRWDDIGDGLYIEPFETKRLGAGTYDLTVGPEFVSVRDPYTVRKLEEKGQIEVGPGETVLILTEEFVAVPRNLAAVIVPRARLIFQGAAINATRVDPTWYGRLLVGFTNQSKYPFNLGRGEAFCTCLFAKIGVPERTLQELRVAHLGRLSIGRIDMPNIRHRDLKEPDQVQPNDLRDVVGSFGPPFDVVRGAIERQRTEIIEHLNRELAPEIVADARQEAAREAFDKLYDLQKSWLGWQKAFIASFIAIMSVFVGLLTWFLAFRTP